MQTDFYEAVGKRWGLQRGKEGSQKKHLSTAEFKAKKIIEQAEAVQKENQVYADALTDAKSGNIPRKRGKLQEQVIALTADNNDLSKRLTKAMDETLEYARKSEALQKEKDKNEKYTHAGKTLARIAPNTYRGITYGMSSVGLFFSAFADFCTPSVQSQIPLLQKIEQEMREEKERYEWLNGKNGAHK